MELLKVKSSSKASAVAGAIAMSMPKTYSVKLCAIGAGAVNQSCKAIAIARGYLAPKGITFNTQISFATVTIDGNDKTALEFTLTSNLQKQ